MLKIFGMSDPEIATLRQEIIDWESPALRTSTSMRCGRTLLSSIDAADADMAEVSSEAAAIIAYYAYSVDDDYPAANAGGPYTGTAGSPGVTGRDRVVRPGRGPAGICLGLRRGRGL